MKIHLPSLKILQNHWAIFNQTWHKASLGEGDQLKVLQARTIQTSKRDNGFIRPLINVTIYFLALWIWSAFSVERCGPWASCLISCRLWKNLNSHHPRMLCAKFGWNWPGGSGSDFLLNFVNVYLLFHHYLPLEKDGPFYYLIEWVVLKIFKLVNVFFAISKLSPLGKRRDHSFEQTWISFTQGCFVPCLVEIGPVVLEKKIKMWKV